ncbi:hypothetical protein HDE_13562 [Halotydeus destructor]|nr:hypothetical protein HDE_13562 [Halotydeus destructor]
MVNFFLLNLAVRTLKTQLKIPSLVTFSTTNSTSRSDINIPELCEPGISVSGDPSDTEAGSTSFPTLVPVFPSSRVMTPICIGFKLGIVQSNANKVDEPEAMAYFDLT